MKREQLKRMNAKHEIKKQMNRVIDTILKMSNVLANENNGDAVKRLASKTIQRKELELNTLWYEYNRFIGLKNK